MTSQPRMPGRVRTATVVAVLRAFLSATLMVVVYYRAPLDRRVDGWVVFWFAAGLVGLAAALAWQVRSIMRSDTPRLRAAETIAIGLPFLLLLYAAVYALISVNQPASFTQRLGRTDALYFTMTVFTTVGFGDITPVTEATRILVMTQMVAGLLVVGVVAKLLFGAVQIAVGRQAAAAEQPGPAARPAPTDEPDRVEPRHTASTRDR